MCVGVTITDPEILFPFWVGKASDIPTWHKFAMYVASIPTSSGSVERVMSVFTNTITPQMLRSKEQTVEARVLYRYNHRQKSRRRKHRFDDDFPLDDFSEEEIWEEEVLEEGV